MKASLPHLLDLPLLLLQAATTVSGMYNWDIVHFGLVSGWKWEKPWGHDDSDLMNFDLLCKHAAEFKARQYKFADLDKAPPEGLAPWKDAIEDLATGRVYPGSWDGVNVKGKERDILMMDYKDVPELVRGFIEEQLATEDGRNRHFFRVLEKPKVITGGRGAGKDDQVDFKMDISALPVEQKVWVTAPGELYPILPLWVAQGSKCPDAFKDLSQYVATHAKETCVVAWPTDHSRKHLEEGKKEITFRIEARQVKETAEGKAVRVFWEAHQRELERMQRKINREERAAARKGVEKERKDEKDEL